MFSIRDENRQRLMFCSRSHVASRALQFQRGQYRRGLDNPLEVDHSVYQSQNAKADGRLQLFIGDSEDSPCKGDFEDATWFEIFG
jgi:hypothetical protein